MSDPYKPGAGVPVETGPMNEIAERFRTRSAEFARRVDAVPEDRWDAPSPCTGWTARDVLDHMLDNVRTMPRYAGVAGPELPVTAADDPRRAWQEASAAMQAILDDPELAGTAYDGYFGRTTLGDTVDRFLGFDLVVHAWDIARATGGDERLPDDEVRALWAQAQDWGDTIRMEGICGPEVPVPDGAPVQDRLLAFVGRNP